jgi:putative spermidine/putrescine transport system substrate-binding protein
MLTLIRLGRGTPGQQQQETSTMRNRLIAAISVAALLSSTSMSLAQSLQELEAAAIQEGMLSVIALPDDWCGWRGVIDAFKAKYPGITVNELNPDAGSADEIEAIKANIGNTGPQAPDVIDVGLSYAASATKDGLLLPYKVSMWDQIRDDAKDPEGHWYGGYYGTLAFIVNKDLVENSPTDWADLLKPEYNGQVAVGGDPRTANQAIHAVWGAGLAATGGDVDKAAEAGLEFMKQLNDMGNFVPTEVKSAQIAQGATPIGIAWDYNELAWQASLNGNPPTEIIVPKSAVISGFYAQAISAHAPHPNAGKLWLEYIYGEEGQLGLLKGYCHPIRFDELSAAGKIPAELAAALPPAESYQGAVFPTLEQQGAFKDYIAKNWDAVVGANVN